jgi:membrane associated rhomboid family serine protease/TolA-binding protein
MTKQSYKIVFAGELAFDTDESEARSRLAKECKFSPEAIDKLFCGRQVILKNGLAAAVANRYKNRLDQLGILVSVVNEAPPPKSELQPLRQDTAPETATEKQGRSCPKCGARNQTDKSCEQCGLIFARFEQAQTRRLNAATPDALLQPAEETPEVNFFDQHPELLFILKAFGVIALILLLQSVLRDFLLLFIVIFPIGFLAYIRLQAVATGESSTELLAQHITFMPVMYSKEERQQEYLPKITYGLILANILVFYLFQLWVDPLLIINNLIFLPYEPNTFNVPISMLSSIFLHGSQGHLWGNMLFLWAVGTVVERRIGSLRFGIFYLLSGITGNLVYLLICTISSTPPHILGASGAIAGVMGLFAIRCYFKSMTFPLPILGIFSLIFPVSLKVKLNSLVIIGLFFLADLSGGIEQIQGTSASNTGHWAHIGGMLCGILLALAFRLNRDAILERHMELGSQAVGAKIGAQSTEKGEESLRLLLQKDPENCEAQLLLARLKSKFAATEEGKELYNRVIPQLVLKKPEEAMIVYHEYRKTYNNELPPATLYRMANIFHRHEDPQMACSCLQLVCQDQKSSALLLEKALYQCGRILEEMEQNGAAADYYQRCIDSFPDSPLSSKAKARIEQPQFAAS